LYVARTYLLDAHYNGKSAAALARQSNGRCSITSSCAISRGLPPKVKSDLEVSAISATNRKNSCFGLDVQTLSARDAKYNFGRLNDMARAEPVTVEKHGRVVIVVLAVEECERLKAIESEQSTKELRSVERK